MPGSLFERITLGEAGERMDEDESIRRHILRMFTARQGSVQALPDYGLPDINDLTLSRAELAKTTAEAVRTCIAAYEPRLTGVEVHHIPMPESSFTMGFRIRALRQDANGGVSPWQWDISVSGDTVRGRT